MSTIEVSTPSDTEIRMTRVFDAPIELVFAAHSQAEHLRHWWGRGNPLDVEIDFRVGGRYRFVEHADSGTHAFRGEFREISTPDRIVQTFEYEGAPGHIAVETLLLTERDGRTHVDSVTRFETRAERDGMLAGGMTDGADRSYVALQAYLATLS